jgi:tetratricopeptide (TPR) repeat protein
MRNHHHHPPFDPLQASSATTTILRQSNDDLTDDERVLKECLERYQEMQMQQQPADNNNNDNDDDDSYYIWEDLHQAYVTLGYWEEALGVEQTKCDLYFTNNDTDEYADSIHLQGKYSLRQGDFNNSKRLYEQALAYYRSQKNPVQQGHVLISLAGWYYFRDKLDLAMQHLMQSEPLLDQAPSLLVKCLDNQGLIHRILGDYGTALDKYRQALQVVVDEETRQALQLHVADMLVALEEPEQALEVYQELLLLLNNHDNPGMQGVLLHNIATIHVDRGEYELALEEFHQALHCKQQAANPAGHGQQQQQQQQHHPEVAKTWTSLGALHAGVLNDPRQALECFQHALRIARINAGGREDSQRDPEVLATLQHISMLEKQQLDKEK